MLTASTLDHPRIRHGFFTREGGVSEGIYAGLNCGPGSSDDAQAVAENRRRAQAMLGLGENRLVTCYQVHSPTVVRVEAPWEHGDAPRADAMVTNRPGVVLGILTADCAPVLFADVEAGVIGAAHAGWKGAVGGVLRATVAEMVALGAKTERIHAVVGPCIHQPSYEVGEDLRLQVISATPWADWCFERAARPGHYQFDLPSYVSGELQRQDLGAVEVLDFDTYTDEQRFFSYRRTTHRGEPDYGRQISAIGLTP
ncbi:peptidoglycan editing factor PgeF [Magnetovibrio sp.]|uniref:peptidoglycan editing factor PgeF n=1 Tax=Magnetovibrio sp. TaxID=2024836 RepID=UPI002F92A33C